MTTQDYITHIDTLFATQRHEENARAMSKYMKYHFVYYGLKSPQRRELQKLFISEYGLPNQYNWQEICREMWVCDEREVQYFGMEIVFRMKKHWTKKDIELIEFVIVNKSWWDTVDFIASNIVGHYFATYPEEIPKILPRWNASTNMWLNRVSIIFQLKYKNDTDFDLMKKFIQPHLSSSEFFHQKAIGWALRQYAKFEPELVKQYVNKTNLKPLSKREALKHF